MSNTGKVAEKWYEVYGSELEKKGEECEELEKHINELEGELEGQEETHRLLEIGFREEMADAYRRYNEIILEPVEKKADEVRKDIHDLASKLKDLNGETNSLNRGLEILKKLLNGSVNK